MQVIVCLFSIHYFAGATTENTDDLVDGVIENEVNLSRLRLIECGVKAK